MYACVCGKKSFSALVDAVCARVQSVRLTVDSIERGLDRLEAGPFSRSVTPPVGLR